MLPRDQFKSLHDYIIVNRQKDYKDEYIVQALKDAGWTEALINLGFKVLAGGTYNESEQIGLPADRIIECSQIKKEYASGKQTTVALRDVNFKIKKGEFVAIMGPSGSGKSTLMHILGLLDSPSFGSYRLLGQEVSSLKESRQAEFRNRHLGFVFQQFNLLPRATVLENILLPSIYNHSQNIEERAKEIIEIVGLKDRMEYKSNQLSGGQMQRVAIARALLLNPQVIFADEPTGNLDSKTAEDILHLFKNINQADKTIVMVTHDEHVASHANRIIRLKDGQIISDENNPVT